MSEPIPGSSSWSSATMPWSMSTTSATWALAAGLMQAMPATSGWSQRGPQRERATHRQARDDHLVAPSLPNAGTPARPLLTSRSTTWSSCPRRSSRGPAATGSSMAKPAAARASRDPAHRARVAGEAVDAQRPSRSTIGGPRLGPGRSASVIECLVVPGSSQRRGRWRRPAPPTNRPGSRSPPSPGTGRCSSPDRRGGTCRNPSTAPG